MKKIIVVLWAMIMVLGMTACAGETKLTPDERNKIGSALRGKWEWGENFYMYFEPGFPISYKGFWYQEGENLTINEYGNFEYVDMSMTGSFEVKEDGTILLKLDNGTETEMTFEKNEFFYKFYREPNELKKVD